MHTKRVAIIDYGLGNIFSLQHACSHVGLSSIVTSDKKAIAGADCVILPGVGAFGDAMVALRNLDLIEPVKDIVASGKILVGICLGMQLLMSESHEFGIHDGLNLIEGSVLKLATGFEGHSIKVPHVGWDTVSLGIDNNDRDSRWNDGLFGNIPQESYMYFVHSYYVNPINNAVISSQSTYGGFQFCSSIQCGTIYGFQFHPERSGECGLQLYRNLVQLLNKNNKKDIA